MAKLNHMYKIGGKDQLYWFFPPCYISGYLSWNIYAYSDSIFHISSASLVSRMCIDFLICLLGRMDLVFTCFLGTCCCHILMIPIHFMLDFCGWWGLVVEFSLLSRNLIILLMASIVLTKVLHQRCWIVSCKFLDLY